MKNFPITDPITGQIHWISRSVATVGIISVYEKNKKETFAVLMVKRGKSCPDEVGKWCLPCGYLDFDETAEECINREVFEETGLKLESWRWALREVNTNPSSNKQNVSLIYLYDETDTNAYGLVTGEFGYDDERLKFNERIGGEEGEVDEVKWINITELDNYDIAFNHKELIKTYA